MVRRIGVDGMYKIYADMIYDLPYGEKLQIQFRKEFLSATKIDAKKLLEDYLIKSYYKTGSLFSGVLRGVTKIIGATDEVYDKVFKLGIHLGVAFQISDDLNDLTQATQTIGKTSLNDLTEMNFTAPYILLLWELQNREKDYNKVFNIFKNKNRSEQDVKLVLEYFRNSTAHERTRLLSLHHLEKGIELINQISQGENRNELINFAKSLVLRSK